MLQMMIKVFYKMTYHDDDTIKLGNDSGMSVKHVGNTCVTIPNSNTAFNLNHLLYFTRIFQYIEICKR